MFCKRQANPERKSASLSQDMYCTFPQMRDFHVAILSRTGQARRQGGRRAVSPALPPPCPFRPYTRY